MRFIKKHAIWLFLLALLVIHLAVINQYGLTWDFHFHFFGGGKLLGLDWQQLEPRPLPYVEPDPRRAWTLPYGPLMSIPPVASFLWLYQHLHLLDADSAYHLPIVLWGVAGVAILFFFLKEAINTRIAWLGALFLALYPRFFGDMHNNMKDVPSAVVFGLNVWLLWRLIHKKRVLDLILGVIGFAVAFNVKINSIFIPVIFLVFLLVKTIFEKAQRGNFFADRFSNSETRGHAPTGLWNKSKMVLTTIVSSGSRKNSPRKANIVFVLYFILAPLAAFALWSLFWRNPVFQLDHAYRTFGIGTNNIEVLLNGDWYCSGSTVPWYYPLWYLAIVTPIPLLVFFMTGLIHTLLTIKNQDKTNLLFVLWFIIPLTRYLSPTVGVIDGIRHFEEVVLPLCALAAIGMDWMLTKLARMKSMRIALIVGIGSWLLWNIVAYHPYQITYFNELVGGARGAFGKYDLDYWGTSQKEAIAWVNAHAKPHAKIHIVMAPNVAGTYLRPDLLPNLNKFGYDESDMVVFLNRQSFYYRFFYSYEYLLVHKPAHTISAAGAPLTWIFDNTTDNRTPKQTPWWKAEDPCILQYWKK
jgi:4-amino-4-deoxy-L-arabinose transferase-like glycosyltransferase